MRSSIGNSASDPIYVAQTSATTDANGNAINSNALPAGTDRSGTTSSSAGTATQLAPANNSRRKLTIQNVSGNNIGINEVGGTAAIGQPGTYTIPAGANANVSTNRAISVVGAAASLNYTATES